MNETLTRNRTHFFWWVMLGKSHGGLCKAPTEEERRERMAKRGERLGQVY